MTRAPLPIPSPIPASYQPTSTIETHPLTTPLETILTILSRDGGIIIKDFIPQSDLTSITTELEPWSTTPRRDSTPNNPNKPNDAFHTIPPPNEPRPGLGAIEMNSIDPLLSLSVSLNIGYGAPRQLLHRDDNVHHIRHKGGEKWGFDEASQFGCLIAGCDVTREMGATMFVPGSHRWGDDRMAGAGEVCFAEMTAGSALIFLASTFHGGGHNSVPGTVRTMHSLFFVRGNLRTEENQFLAVPRSKVREMGPKMLELLGYKKPTTALGIVDNISPHEDIDGVWERAMQ
ncbi:phytanoyl-CoA dioxygenase [Aspergillus ellipticus CBS 707.79]|uniref:Phytanoyl-CoA dioxygenase n=1 Tax=Aspergillus ellipticus CBS 707.79 TaxID=1448320 RepID=A0A319DGJ9_9EURO|nr:phytanoyl-CoA dioxygenase [Aspergillus ellipticus CBS 707.79]